MKIIVEIDKNLEETEITIKTREHNSEIEDLIKKINQSQEDTDIIFAYDQGDLIPIAREEIYYFYSHSKKVYVKSRQGEFEIKKRLYEIEEMDKDFLRISNTEIVRIKEIKRIDLKYSGTIMMILKNGDELYVSRRYMNKVKRAFGIGG